MAFVLDPARSLPDELRRAAHEQTAAAIAELRGETDDAAGAAVHRARKCCKRVRALLRLVREPLGKKVYKRENAAYRDAARLLSELRDAQVLVSTLDAVGEQYALDVEAEHFVLATLLANRTNELRTDDRRERAADALAAAAERIDGWALDGGGWELLAPGFGRVADQVRDRRKKALTAKRGTKADHAFHDWRKRVKYHWHHLELLEELWPPVLSTVAAETHRLSDLLGEEHDLTMLRSTLLEKGLPEEEDRRELLLALVDGRRLRLRQETKPLADRLTALSPKRQRTLAKAWFEAASSASA